MAPDLYQKGSYSLDPFAPKGEPEKLNHEGGQKPKTEREVDEALAEFAPIATAGKSSALAADGQAIDIPFGGKDSETSMEQSVYNRKGKSGGTAD